MADLGTMGEYGTVHLLLKGLASFPAQQNGPPEPTLASTLVVQVWNQPSYDRCNELAREFKNQCALDNDHGQPEDSKDYFSAFWLATGFYRVSIIANSLSLGVDSLFIDTDTVILRDFLPLIRSLDGADIVTSTEKCIIRNYSRPYDRVELGAWTTNIGFMYLRAVPGNLRCTISWMAKMFHDTVRNGKTWDQVAFNAVFPDCHAQYGLTWYGLDPRRFQLGCGMAGFRQCGCAFDDADFAGVGPIPAREERMSPKFLPFSAPGVCGPADWKDWYTKHFNCILGSKGSDPQTVKAMYMRNLMEAAQKNAPGAIMPSKENI